MEHEKIEIGNDTRKYIIDELVEPYYKTTVENTIQGKTCWRKTGITFETLSKVMVALGSILSFSAGYYHDDTLSFISGSISCLSLASLQFSSFSYKENKKQGDELNILLKKLKLDTVPALARDDFGMQVQSRQNANLLEQAYEREFANLSQQLNAAHAALNEKKNPYKRNFERSISPVCMPVPVSVPVSVPVPVQSLEV